VPAVDEVVDAGLPDHPGQLGVPRLEQREGDQQLVAAVGAQVAQQTPDPPRHRPVDRPGDTHREATGAVAAERDRGLTEAGPPGTELGLNEVAGPTPPPCRPLGVTVDPDPGGVDPVGVDPIEPEPVPLRHVDLPWTWPTGRLRTQRCPAEVAATARITTPATLSPASEKGPLVCHEVGTTSAVAGRGLIVVLGAGEGQSSSWWSSKTGRPAGTGFWRCR